MMPISRESDDWRDLVKDVADLKTGQGRVEERLDNLMNQQRNLHNVNQTEINDLKLVVLGDNDSPGLKTVLYSLNSNIKLVKWLLGILIAGLSLYYAQRELTHKGVAESKTVISSNVDATAGATHY